MRVVVLILSCKLKIKYLQSIKGLLYKRQIRVSSNVKRYWLKLCFPVVCKINQFLPSFMLFPYVNIAETKTLSRNSIRNQPSKFRSSFFSKRIYIYSQVFDENLDCRMLLGLRLRFRLTYSFTYPKSSQLHNNVLHNYWPTTYWWAT